MKRKLLLKIRNIGIRIYDLEVRKGCGGLGGCISLNNRELTKLRKLRRFYNSHPRLPEYELWCSQEIDRILGAYCWEK